MNKVILMGRLTRDPEVRYSQGEQSTAVARYTLAVDRRGRNQENSADFIACVAFGKAAEFAERYLHKGTKIVLTGRNTDRQLHQQGRSASIYDRHCCGGPGVCREQKHREQQHRRL